MKRPRIQVSAQYLSAGSGGIARCARITVQALAPEARVSALAVEDETSPRLDNVRTRSFAGSRPAFVAANAIGALSSDWVVYDFAGTARAHGPLRLTGKPYAVWAHGVEVWPGLLRADYERAIRGAKAVFVNSRHTYGRLSQSMPDLKTLRLCPLGTEKDVERGDAAVLGARRELLVLFVGRNDGASAKPPHEPFGKGQLALIAAWPKVVEQVPGAVLCFVGGGDGLDQLRQFAAASPAAASIKVLGRLSDAEVAALYRRARLFAMLSKVEGFGLVFSEAMSHGLPVLTSTEDASAELNIEGETGFSVSREHTDLGAQRIVSVLKDERLFASLSQKAYERWAREYCFSAFQDRFLGAATDAGLLKRSPLLPQGVIAGQAIGQPT